jgi:hypothetical protein
VLGAFWQIDTKNIDRCPTDCGMSSQIRPVPPKVRTPFVISGMEEPRKFSCIGVVAGYINGFERVTAKNSKRKDSQQSSDHDDTAVGCDRW